MDEKDPKYLVSIAEKKENRSESGRLWDHALSFPLLLTTPTSMLDQSYNNCCTAGETKVRLVGGGGGAILL